LTFRLASYNFLCRVHTTQLAPEFRLLNLTGRPTRLNTYKLEYASICLFIAYLFICLFIRGTLFIFAYLFIYLFLHSFIHNSDWLETNLTIRVWRRSLIHRMRNWMLSTVQCAMPDSALMCRCISVVWFEYLFFSLQYFEICEWDQEICEPGIDRN
jgi:hypothetical protein